MGLIIPERAWCFSRFTSTRLAGLWKPNNQTHPTSAIAMAGRQAGEETEVAGGRAADLCLVNEGQEKSEYFVGTQHGVLACTCTV